MGWSRVPPQAMCGRPQQRARRSVHRVSSEECPFVGDAESDEHSIAAARQAPGWADAQRDAFWQSPRERRRNVMRSPRQRALVLLSESAIHFDAERNVFGTEATIARRCGESKRATRSERIAELPRLAGEVFFCDEIAREVPAASIARQNQLRLELAFLLVTRLVGRFRKIAP